MTDAGADDSTADGELARERSRAGIWGVIAGVVMRPVTVTMVTVALLLFGIVALTRMPVELLPDLGYPSITVQTEYTDAAPAEVEELVTRPIEELVGGVPGVVAVESSSREGVSEVMLDFAWGTRIDDAMADVREKLDRVRLPTESERPIVLRYDPSQEPILRFALVVESADGVTNFRALRDLADESIKQTLEKLDGVAAVQLHGGDEEEVIVELDPERLAALGIDASEVVAAIGADNINRPGGGLTDDGNRYLIRTVHEAKTPEALGQIIVREGTTTSGELRLRELVSARGIRRAPLEREEVSLVGPAEAIELAVFREGDANTVRVADKVLERIEQLSKQLPEGHRLVVLSNQASFIDAAIMEVALNTLIGGGLAILVLLFFLRDLRSTLVIGVAIPISLLVSFVPLTTLGISLNLMSLGGLALGVGMLVDNSIVTLEAIARIREQQPELGRRETAVRGTVEIASSVVASTLTTVAVFFPMAFVEGVAGQLVSDLAYAVSFSILSSMVVSLTLVPVLQAIGDGDGDADADAEAAAPEGKSKRSALAWLVAIPALLWVPIRLLVRGLGWLLERAAWPLTRGWELLEAQYPRFLSVALKGRIPVLLLSLGVCALVLWSGRDLGRTLLPEVRQGEVYVQIELPQGTALERSTALTRGIMRELDGDPRLELVFARVGSVTQGGSATGGQAGTHLVQINFRLRPELVAAGELEAVEDQLFTDVTAATERVLDGVEHRARFGRPELFSFESPVEVRVFADESADAIAHTLRLLPRLREIEGLADVAADDLSGRPEVRVDFDRERLMLAGLDVDRAAAAIQRGIQGEVAGQLHATDKQLDIRVRLPEVDRSDITDVQRIQVGVVGGTTDAVTGQRSPPKSIPLTAVARVEPAVGPAEIRRIDGRRGLRIRARADAGDLGSLAAQINDALDVASAQIPAGTWVETELAGQAEEMGDSLESLAFTALLSIFLVYVVMASSFESLHHPFLIMFTVPLAAVGVVLACLLTGTPISAMVGIGAIILGGIVVNNAIVLISAVNQRRGAGMDVRAALIDAGKVRVRPILMTTATTVLGLLPMAFGLGEGAALRQPLALAVIGGLVVATALTLVVIPCAYALAPGRKRAAWGDSEP
ncbi:efflux RND transporter permease subunit [Enhygromyxa salina]|uniref:Cobalt-zinc-cadmium resistance protein CzcA n=1 Tax=Enhygromyxa salina TaxID=215803 RepID=A0A2S9YLY3_9BACT|nr:efflux RND transporter permease subunit [Enhygromyxa salina]PRQ06100.1 Cobalt-zinc-cadmium resistance protein CzcA [Enhygromyxa salina]